MLSGFSGEGGAQLAYGDHDASGSSPDLAIRMHVTISLEEIHLSPLSGLKLRLQESAEYSHQSYKYQLFFSGLFLHPILICGLKGLYQGYHVLTHLPSILYNSPFL